MRVLSLLVGASLIIVGMSACGSGGPLDTGPTGPAVSISPVGVQLDAIGARADLTATVFESGGVPKPDATVAWSVVDSSIVTIDTAGVVVARRNGTTMVEARYQTLVGQAEVRVRQIGVTLFKVSGDVQTGVVGGPLPRPLVAQVDDRLGHPVQGATVFFRVQTGGGTLSDPAPHTDASGRAHTTWTLGPAEGDQIVVASLTPGAITPALYNAVAVAR